MLKIKLKDILKFFLEWSCDKNIGRTHEKRKEESEWGFLETRQTENDIKNDYTICNKFISSSEAHMVQC